MPEPYKYILATAVCMFTVAMVFIGLWLLPIQLRDIGFSVDLIGNVLIGYIVALLAICVLSLVSLFWT